MVATESYPIGEVLGLLMDTLVALFVPYEEAQELVTPQACFECALEILFWHDYLLGQAIIPAPPGQPFTSTSQIPHYPAEKLVAAFWGGMGKADHPLRARLLEWTTDKDLCFLIDENSPRDSDHMPAVFHNLPKRPLDSFGPLDVHCRRVGRLFWRERVYRAPPFSATPYATPESAFDAQVILDRGLVGHPA